MQKEIRFNSKTNITELMSKVANNTLTREDRLLLEQLRKAAFEYEATLNTPVPDPSTDKFADIRPEGKVPRFSDAYHAQMGVPVYMSGTLKTVLIAMAILAVITISGLFYLTVSTLKNNKYPTKTIPRHSYRLR